LSSDVTSFTQQSDGTWRTVFGCSFWVFLVH